MKTLKRLTLAIALTLVVALSAFAGETQAPPCASPEPGETQAPPSACASMTLDEGGALSAPSAGDEYSVSDAALELAQLLLAIF